jgi:hypothetical protein
VADTRSAAGEGSEPRVPDRDQPAQELANLIAQSDAKGKGFWRRRRRKSATPPEAPTTPASTPPDPEPEPKPAEPEAAADTTPDTTAQTAASQTPEPGAEAKAEKPAETPADAATVDESAADERAISERAEGERTAQEPVADEAAAKSTGNADDAQPQAADDVTAADDSTPKQAATEGAGDQPAVQSAGDRSAVEGDASDEPGVEVAADQPAAEGGAGDQSAADGPAAEQGAAGDASVPSAGEDAGGDAPAGEQAAAKSTNAESARATVGVVYEPDESPDGFPLEYGNIIVGLPKQQTAANPDQEQADAPEQGEPSNDPSAAPHDSAGAPAEASDETSPAESTPVDEESQTAPSDDDPAPEQPAAATDQPEAPDQPEPGTDPADAPSDDQPAPPEAEAAPDRPADTPEQSDPAPEQPEAAGEQSDAAPEQPGADAEQSDAGSGSDGAESDGGASDSAESDSAESDGAESDGDVPAGAEAEGSSEKPRAEAQEADAESEQAEGASGDGGEAGDGGESGGAEGEGAAEEADAASDQAQPAEEAEQPDEAERSDEAVEELTAEQMAERMAAEQAAMALITALMRLRGALAVSQLPIDVVGADEARQQQKAMLDQLDDYILPRLVQLEAPVLAVVGGSTGAGKSTLVNSIIGKVVSEPGVLRPTTRSPVLIHHPADADWFVGDRVLPGMARSSGESPGGMEDPGHLRLVAADTVPQGLAILDAPDIDSVVEANRDLATQLLAAADLWLFVTTAARYADAVPWDFLQSASDRSTAVAVVLDRSPEDTIDDITGHLAQMLLEHGLGDSPLFSIKETVVDGNGMLPQEIVASIKDWLIDLAADAEARAAVVRRTLHGAVTAMVKKTPTFAEAVRAQAETMIELRSTAETAYDRAVKDIAKATQDGTLLRGEVLARWQEFVGTGELLKGLQTNVGRMRDKMKNAVVGKPPPTRDLNDAVESGLESLLREHAEAAAERAEESWQSTAPGRQLLAAGDRDLGRMSKDFPAAAGRVVRDWQGYVLDLVRKEGADKRSTARILAYGVNGLGLSLMVVIFASTAGITGAEVGVGAGTAVVGQKLLEAVFGDQAVRTLVTEAREDLDGRVHALMDAEFARYLAVLDQHPVDPEAARQLTEAARAVEDCT